MARTKFIRAIHLREYIVKRGESIPSIAAKFNVSQCDLRRINGISGNSLCIGERLNIPLRILRISRITGKLLKYYETNGDDPVSIVISNYTY